MFNYEGRGSGKSTTPEGSRKACLFPKKNGKLAPNIRELGKRKDRAVSSRPGRSFTGAGITVGPCRESLRTRSSSRLSFRGSALREAKSCWAGQAGQKEGPTLLSIVDDGGASTFLAMMWRNSCPCALEQLILRV
jgi:hypothetical protein